MPCGLPQEYPQHEWPHPQPTTNRHSGFPRTAAARAVAQDAIYTCFHYEGQPSMARGPSLAEGCAPAPPLQKPTHLLRAALWASEKRSHRLDADERLRRALPQVATFATLHCLWLSRPLFSEKQGVPRPKRECSGPYSVFELGVKHAAGL